MLAASYPFLDAMWTMFIFFLWILWFWLLFTVFADIFRRHDLSGWGKTGWLVFCIILPFLGVFIYLITQSDGMGQRNIERAQQQQQQFDSYVRQAAGSGGGSGAAGEIERAKALLDNGTITQAEFDAIKQKALTA
jgi:magnesium-transporting ATPase (P-type)